MFGTLQYTAPEYFLGEAGTARSDLFSLGVIAYQMLSGACLSERKCRVAHARRAAPAEIPLGARRRARDPGVDRRGAAKATHPDPNRRYEELSEFVHDLRHPNEGYLNRKRAPLLERNPVAFWKGLSLILAGIVVFLLMR